jgi:hypothetical protein
MHSVRLIRFKPNLLLFNRVVLVQLLKSGLANRDPGILLLMSSSLCNLLSVHGLFFFVKKADTLFLHHSLDRLLNLMVVEGEVNVL